MKSNDNPFIADHSMQSKIKLFRCPETFIWISRPKREFARLQIVIKNLILILWYRCKSQLRGYNMRIQLVSLCIDENGTCCMYIAWKCPRISIKIIWPSIFILYFQGHFFQSQLTLHLYEHFFRVDECHTKISLKLFSRSQDRSHK